MAALAGLSQVFPGLSRVFVGLFLGFLERMLLILLIGARVFGNIFFLGLNAGVG
jgi:hypothetical protein